MTARKDEAPPDDAAPAPARRVTLCTAIPWATFHYTGDGSVIDGDLVITNTGISLPVDAAAEVTAAARWSGVPLLEKD